MTTLDQKKHSRRLRKLISSDTTLSKIDRDKILDAINLLCDENYKNRFNQRMKIQEVATLIKNKEHIQARKGFFGIVKLYNKRNEIKDIILG